MTRNPLAEQLAALRRDLDAVRLRGGTPPDGKPPAYVRMLLADIATIRAEMKRRGWSDAGIDQFTRIFTGLLIGPSRPAAAAEPDYTWIDGRWKRVPTEETT
jgi:hypothetical protein